MVVSMAGPMIAEAVADPTVGGTGSLSVHKFYFPNQMGETIDGTGEVQTPPAGTVALAGAKFTIWPVADDAVVGNPGNTGAGTEMTTDAAGELTFPNLPYGRYYVVETFLPHGVTQGSAPFMVDIPTTSVDQTRLIDDVHVYPKNVLTLGAAELTKYKENQGFLQGAKFDLYKVGPDTEEADLKINTDLVTDGNGKIAVGDLEVGDYYFVETSTPSPYLLDTTPLTFTIEPGDHAYAEGAIIPDQVKQVSLTNSEEPGNPVKTVDKSSADIGEIVEWTITTVLPTNIAAYESYKITDTIDPRLDYVSSTIDLNGTPLPAAAYVLTTTANVPGFKVELDFDPAQLAPGTLVVKVKTKINNTAELGTPIPNQAKIDYNNKFTTGEKETDEVTVETGGYNFKKIIKGTETGLAGAEFIVGRADNKYAKQDPTTQEITWVAKADATKFVSPADGKFSVNGLAYGDYFLEEVKAPTGYAKLQATIPFIVSKVSHTADPYCIANKTKPTMPQTGGMGTILFTILGLGLMGAAAKSYKKEEK